ncbi:MAG: tetratricopeptide repeat protein [Ferruginibacter sp.]
MADKKVTVTTEDNITTETYTVKKNFWESYGKTITYASSALILLLGAYFGYQKLVKEPKEQDAAAIIFPAESLFDKMAQSGFSKDSVNIVLNGGVSDGVNITGLLKIVSKYGGTLNANRAEYMIGACYLHIKEFDKAVKHLNEYNSNGASQIEIKKYMLLGSAYAEQKKTEEALGAYKKAASVNEKDEAFTADALITAAAYADYIGKPKDAVELYQKAQDNYPTFPSVQSGEVEKQLAKLGVTK